MPKVRYAISFLVIQTGVSLASWTGSACKYSLCKLCSLVFPHARHKQLASVLQREVRSSVAMVNVSAAGVGETSSPVVSEKSPVLKPRKQSNLDPIAENSVVASSGDMKERRYSSLSPATSKGQQNIPTTRVGNLTRERVRQNRSSNLSSQSSVSARSLTNQKSDSNLPPIAPRNGFSSARTQNTVNAGIRNASSRSNSQLTENQSSVPVNTLSESVFRTLTSSFANLGLSSKSASVKQTRSKSLSVHRHQSYTTIPDLVRGLKGSNFQNIVVVQGAGVSTGSGIPDFRSKGTGLYSNLAQYNIPYPEAIFDIDFFRLRPKPFYTLAKELYPSGKYKPNVVHYFIRLLFEKQMLLRVYTQNIDGLERLAGIPPGYLVESHGTFTSSSCIRCGKAFPTEDMKAAIFSGIVAKCHSCKQGLVKPDITFFGEDLPKRFFMFSRDFPKADLIIVMGTSLEVEPFCSIIGSSKPSVPRLLLNRDKVGPFKRSTRPTDMSLIGELEASVWDLIRQLGWTQELKDLIRQHEPKLPKFEDIADESNHNGNVSSHGAGKNNAVQESSAKIINKNSTVTSDGLKANGFSKNDNKVKNGVGSLRPMPRNNTISKPNSVVRSSNFGTRKAEDNDSRCSTSESSSGTNSTSS